jgi:5-methylthioadenosine/S-adenosylhomocysteine deaminase
MATYMGAKAIHMGELIGSLEPGKRADMILVDLSNLHNTPRFRRDSSNIYAKLVYAGKSTDVTDVMVNGKWLMRDRQLLTLNETELLAQANEYAVKIDAFLIEREQSVLSKLIAIEGVEEEESFEVQAKVSLEDIAPILESIEKANIEILHHRHYHQFDTYFHFIDTSQGLLRYREDEISDVKNRVTNMRYRLTLIGRAREGHFPSDVLLSRSRYLAPATHSLRFYREYFEPSGETFIEKERQRWRVLYKGTEFYINLDQVKTPDLGIFLEVKSRTWSRGDAENKAYLVTELITVLLGRMPEEMVTQDYLELVSDKENHGKYVA